MTHAPYLSMAEKTKRTVWFWIRSAFLLLVVVAVASAGTDDWEVFLPGATFMIGGFFLILGGVSQWIIFLVFKRSIPYSLSVNPFSGECRFITGFIPYVLIAIALGTAIAVVIDGFWPGFWHVGILCVIGGFWMRWNRLLARRYCREK